MSRQDLLSAGLFGGVTVAMFGTAFAAALLGSLVAPVFTESVNRIMEFELPDFVLPETEDTEEAVQKVRALEEIHPWLILIVQAYKNWHTKLKLERNKLDKFNDNQSNHE